MTVNDYARIVREQWVTVCAVTLLAVIGAGVIWVLRPPEYTAHLTLYVSAQTADTADTADTANAAYQGSLLSQQRVSSYVKLAGSTRVSREVIRDLDLTGSPEAVAGQVSASSPPDSVLIDVAVVGRSPEQVADVANSVGGVFTDLVAELERPATPGAVAAVVVRVVEPATVPAGPSSPGLPVPLVLGLMVGAVAGVGLALARNALDNSIATIEQLREVTQAPNLGTIAYDGTIPKRPLTLHEKPQSHRAEAFRQLRTSLQYVDVDHPRKVLVVTSALSGEGKTTSVCNLAIAMAAAGSRVLVVEADLRRPMLADLLGLERSAGLTDVLSGRLRSAAVIQPWAGGRFDVLASGPLPPNPSELLASRQMVALLDELRGRYDAVLVDSPPLLPVTDAAAMAPATDGVILVCRFREATRDQVGRAVDTLSAVAVPVLGTVFTMVPRSGSRGDGAYYGYSSATERPASAAGLLAAERPVQIVDRA